MVVTDHPACIDVMLLSTTARHADCTRIASMESPGHLSGHATIASIDFVIQVKTIYMSANNSKRPKL